jgi:hypothetical protein
MKQIHKDALNRYINFIELHNQQEINLCDELSKSKMGVNPAQWVAAGIARKVGRGRYAIVSNNHRKDAMAVLRELKKIRRYNVTPQSDLFQQHKPAPMQRKKVSILWGLITIES